MEAEKNVHEHVDDLKDEPTDLRASYVELEPLTISNKQGLYNYFVNDFSSLFFT